jgi:hypothetical protein
LLKRKTGQRFAREDVFRADDFFAVARPPRAPAARTDIVPRPLVVREDDVLRVDDFLAVARPPCAPAFFFCAVVPARPPFAPAAFTDIVPRELVLRAVVAVFFRDVVDVFLRAVAEVDLGLELARDAVLVFFREDVPPPREELALRDEDDFEDDEDDDFVSPDFARCLLTVRAAISFARFVDRPCFCSESFTCSYCRSRFALHDWGIASDLLMVSWPANTCPRCVCFMRVRRATASTSARRRRRIARSSPSPARPARRVAAA